LFEVLEGYGGFIVVIEIK